MLTDSSKKDIQKISLDILKQSKALDIFPTPVEKIVNYTELVTDNKIDLNAVDKGFFKRFKEGSRETFKVLQAGLSKVKGFFDRTEKTIYVDVNQSFGRQNFVKLHEVGHGVLPWQNEVFLALDNNKTLLSSFDDQFEAEANFFASITLFQQDRFLAEIANLPLSLSSGMALSKKFGSSAHAALRNFVINSPKKCALLVLTPINKAVGNKAICQTRNMFYSNSFLSEIGELELPNEFGFKWGFVQDYRFKKRFHEKGEIILPTVHGEELNSNYHYFNNTFNSFVFIFPKGEVNRVKTKVVVTS